MNKSVDKKQQRYYINEQIRGDKILLIDDEGNKLGIFSRKDALEKAEQLGVDLIQIGYNPNDRLVVAKLMDYGKFMYNLKKQEKEKKKGQKVKGLKEIKIGYNIGKKDLEVKIERAKKMLQEGYSVRIFGELRGREHIYKDNMIKRLEEIKEILSDYGKPQDIKEERRGYSLVLFAKVK